MAGVISASEPSWIAPFTGLSPRKFRKLVAALLREGADAVHRGRPRGLPFQDRVLLVIAYWRTNSTMRQLAPLFGVSKSAADRVIDRLGPRLALRPRQRFRKGTVLVLSSRTAAPRERLAFQPGKRHTITRTSRSALASSTSSLA